MYYTEYLGVNAAVVWSEFNNLTMEGFKGISKAKLFVFNKNIY